MPAPPALTDSMVATAFLATVALDADQPVTAFAAGDPVVYPTHGVGHVDRVGVEDVAGYPLHLIQISFAENRMILRIPLAKAERAGLRGLATPEAFADVLHTLGGRPRSSRLLWAKRAQAYQARINSGDVQVLAEVVRDLQTPANGNTSSFSQRNLFEIALDRLAGEYAAVSRTDKTAAVGRLMDALQQGADAAPLAGPDA